MLEINLRIAYNIFTQTDLFLFVGKDSVFLICGQGTLFLFFQKVNNSLSDSLRARNSFIFTI